MAGEERRKGNLLTLLVGNANWYGHYGEQHEDSLKIWEYISKVKRQPSEWEKIIANGATDKELISKIYKQLMQLNSRKINDPIKKMGQRTK